MPAAKYSLKPPEARRRFKQALLALSGTDWAEKAEQYCDYRLDGKAGGGWLRAKQFTNGTLYLEASTDALLADMAALLENGAAGVSALPVAPRQPAARPSAPAAGTTRGLLEITGTYIGTDESGKGDYFGPLVVAGVVVDDKTAAILRELGVCDSKKLNDRQIGELQRQIIEVVGAKAVNTVEIGPAKYNELYARFKSGGKNLNHMLAWGHATVIENLLTRFPDCRQVIADQFGSEHYIQRQLKEKGKQIELFQTPKAEANVGVAAASIVARHHFVKKMGQLSERFGMPLSFGASSQVKAQAQAIIAAHGREALKEVAKLHFKTTEQLV